MKLTLESIQHYNDGRRYLNPSDHPAEHQERVEEEEVNDGEGQNEFRKRVV